MFYKKTIVMKSIDKGPEKAVVNINKSRNSYSGDVKLYNVKREPSGILTLGLLHGKEVIKAGLNNSGNNLYKFQFDHSKELEDFSCALIQIFNGKPKPMMVGSTKSCNNLENRIASNFNLFNENELKRDVVESQLNKSGVDFDEAECKYIDEEITDELNNENLRCKNCKYREAFYESMSSDESKDSVEEEVLEESYCDEKEMAFYEDVKPQLNTLFDKYEAEEYLEKIIPNSKWVKVNYEEEESFYVVGIIKEEEKIRFICYGVPGVYSDSPPKELQGYSQWLALDDTKPFDKGYWLMYQNADTGENEKVDII